MERIKLKQLLKGIKAEIRGAREIEISSVTANSKAVGPGSLFIAKKTQYIAEAVRGAAAAIVTDLYDPFLPEVVQVVVPDVEEAEMQITNNFYGAPAENLFLIGVTGTNGKTTTSYLIKHLFDACGLIGTVEWVAGSKVFPASLTTPDLVTNIKLFHEMVLQGCTSAVMEVSSHALEQNRVKALPFDIAIFTNLTPEHLDYHSTMEEYAQAKSKLFKMLAKESLAIYNLDDPWHLVMLEQCQARRLSFGFGPSCEVRGGEVALSSRGTNFSVSYQGKKVSFFTPLIGRFNVYNCLGAISAGLAQGKSLEEMARRLESFSRVPGRLERIPNSKEIDIFVDYAHKSDALKNVLETLSELKKGKIITVFGCGGNRDRIKRPKMATVAEKFSDFVIVTSDNPRQEDPEEIVREIIQGFQGHHHYLIDLDRKSAITKAVQMAEKGDIVLIAGKGHETTQIFSDRTVPFDDRQVAREADVMLD